MLKHLDIPPVWTVLFILIAYLLARFLPLVQFSGPVSIALALVFGWAGLGLVLLSALWFLRERTPIEPRRKPKKLLERGPYRINRNPIYTGLILILAGFCFWFGAVSSLLCIPALVVILNTRFIYGEEAALRAAFGDEAEAYIARTRRW